MTRGERLAAVDAAGTMHVRQVSAWAEHPPVTTNANWVTFTEHDEAIVAGGNGMEVGRWQINTEQLLGSFEAACMQRAGK